MIALIGIDCATQPNEMGQELGEWMASACGSRPVDPRAPKRGLMRSAADAEEVDGHSDPIGMVANGREPHRGH